MSRDMQKRLQRLGVVKGARHLQPAPKPAPNPFSEPEEIYPSEPPLTEDYNDDVQSLEMLLPGGYLQHTADGDCFILDKVYPLSYRHGEDYLGDLLAHSAADAVTFVGDGRFADLDFHDFLFIDPETTGLAGAGTIAFMVGVAYFEDNALVVRQYFLRDHGDEPAMLLLLEALLAGKKGVVTFNGRSFDLTLLDRRFLMNRMPVPLLDRPHLDLLMPARRLWRSRFGSCALGSLEQTLLGVRRTHEDVPGWLIPGLYHEYVRTGDARQMMRVFYHNQLDMVSMVTLASRVMRQFAQADVGDHPIDLLSLGRWQVQLGLHNEAEQNLQQAIGGDLSLELYHMALHELAGLWKRNGRRAEAVPLWQQIASTSFDDVMAHVELAMHYEWQEKDVAMAVHWTQQALTLAASMGGNGRVLRAELEHRLNRLQGKL
jgi:uncharacterized protein YprB with RNaseH-like and TPR domain